MIVEQVRGRRQARISMTSTVRDAAKAMLNDEVSALIVTEDGPPRGRIVGIVTERDIATKAAMRYTSFDDLLVADIMQTEVVPIGAGAQISDAVQLMWSRDVRRLAVIDANGEAAGILFFEDVLSAFAREWASFSALMRSEFERAPEPEPRIEREPRGSAESPPRAA